MGPGILRCPVKRESAWPVGLGAGAIRLLAKLKGGRMTGEELDEKQRWVFRSGFATEEFREFLAGSLSYTLTDRLDAARIERGLPVSEDIKGYMFSTVEPAQFPQAWVFKEGSYDYHFDDIRELMFKALDRILEREGELLAEWPDAVPILLMVQIIEDEALESYNMEFEQGYFAFSARAQGKAS
jgi:hypothetical protein